MGLLTVTLLSHDRPHFAVEAIKSILNQTETEFKFVVSDNSSTKELQKIMETDFPSVEYVSWFPGIPAFDHFKEVIALVDTPYFVMFHDDDLMEPNFVKTILEQFRSTPSVAAIGTNASLIDRNSQQIGSQQAFVSRHRVESFSDRREFLMRYLVGDLGGVSPFCSYAYNSKLMQGLFPDFSRARNYCDTIFLTEIAERGPIVWINEPLIKVRVHDHNLSHISGVRDYKAFITLVRRDYGQAINQHHLDEYRFLRLFYALKKRGRLPIAALKFFMLVFPKLLVRSRTFRVRILKKFLQIAKS
jgi:glycosyltransferase involved in cell wall biosynthesis